MFLTVRKLRPSFQPTHFLEGIMPLVKFTPAQNKIIGALVAAVVARYADFSADLDEVIQINGRQLKSAKVLEAAGALEFNFPRFLPGHYVSLSPEWEGRLVITGELACLGGGMWVVSTYRDEARGVTVKVACSIDGDAWVTQSSPDSGLSSWYYADRDTLDEDDYDDFADRMNNSPHVAKIVSHNLALGVSLHTPRP